MEIYENFNFRIKSEQNVPLAVLPVLAILSLQKLRQKTLGGYGLSKIIPLLLSHCTSNSSANPLDSAVKIYLQIDHVTISIAPTMVQSMSLLPDFLK